ncbi:unnamed protein product [Brachionus calyciflorus]|uniref:Coiled-coil domain-containing protein 24 n=1 Tax=Brachionus calyciflorus TaxID=104777 RepID=A0A813PIP7_9BILA|nr:unnamed protein product [Brachionus calyciflorus]
MSDESVCILEPPDTWAYEPPESIWHFIKSLANQQEIDVIENKIGSSLIEESLDLHAEIDTLLEIWRDYRHETERTLLTYRQPQNPKKNLEPANVRNTLKKEIALFLNQLRQQYKMDHTKFNAQILKNNHNLNVINYVLGTPVNKNEDLLNEDRPRTSRSRLGFDTPLIPRPRTKQQLNEQIENLPEDKINFVDIDTIVDKIQTILNDEIKQLKDDIEFLMDCLDKESEFRIKTSGMLKEPSINELKEERKKLESDLLNCKNVVKISGLPTSVSAINSNRSISRITPSPPGSASSMRSLNSVKSVQSVKSVRSVSSNKTLTHRVVKAPLTIVSPSQNVSKLKLDLIQRNNSASSSIDLTSSSSSSMANGQSSSARKFRQMVLESRE